MIVFAPGHTLKYFHFCHFDLIYMESYKYWLVGKLASSFVSDIVKTSMLPFIFFTRSSNFVLIKFILIWPIIIQVILITLKLSNFNPTLKYLDSIFRLVEEKVVELLSVVSLSDWFNETYQLGFQIHII